MATVRYIEHDGRRIELADGAIKYETRCDGCGEYIADTQKISVSLQVTSRAVTPVQTYYEGHPEHVGQLVAQAVAATLVVPF